MSLYSDLNEVLTPYANKIKALEEKTDITDTALDEFSESVNEDIDELKADLNNKVDVTGENQVAPQNIEGMQFTKTTIEVEGENIFDPSTMVYAEGKYVYVNNGVIDHVTTNDFNAYVIPVDTNSKYTFPTARFAALGKGNTRRSEAVGTTISFATQVETGEATYLFLTYPSSTSASTITVKKVTETTTYSNFILPDWMKSDSKKPIDSASGTGTLDINGRTALKDGELITFKGFFNTFVEFSLNFTGSSTSTITNYIKVDITNITIKNTTTSPTPQAHGLTIQNDVTLTVQFIDGTMKITLYSNGVKWTKTVDWNQTDGTVSQPQIAPNGMAFTDAMLIVSYDAVKRSIWYFGDSYTGTASPDRWVYYLKEDGFAGNVLINGSAGSTSGGATVSFNALLKYGTPKMAVMATGMNDGSDGSSAPTRWTQRRDVFLELCTNNEITPIFCTVPTVPSVNNEQKNAWVRSSGYRYIDFAKAVGADGTGTWYSGMLSGDNVHPTATGAKALYTQVLIDLPEITISN